MQKNYYDHFYSMLKSKLYSRLSLTNLDINCYANYQDYCYSIDEDILSVFYALMNGTNGVELASRLNTSRAAISRVWTLVSEMVLNRMCEDAIKKDQMVLSTCFNQNGNLSLAKIAAALQTDIELLDKLITDYIASFKMVEDNNGFQYSAEKNKMNDIYSFMYFLDEFSGSSKDRPTSLIKMPSQPEHICAIIKRLYEDYLRKSTESMRKLSK